MGTHENMAFTYISLSCNTRPVMHHFFLERFLQPADWFQSRLAYTRSVAASSMVIFVVNEQYMKSFVWICTGYWRMISTGCQFCRFR